MGLEHMLRSACTAAAKPSPADPGQCHLSWPSAAGRLAANDTAVLHQLFASFQPCVNLLRCFDGDEKQHTKSSRYARCVDATRHLTTCAHMTARSGASEEGSGQVTKQAWSNVRIFSRACVMGQSHLHTERAGLVQQACHILVAPALHTSHAVSVLRLLPCCYRCSCVCCIIQ